MKRIIGLVAIASLFAMTALPAAAQATCSASQVGTFTYTFCAGSDYSSNTTSNRVGDYLFSNTTRTYFTGETQTENTSTYSPIPSAPADPAVVVPPIIVRPTQAPYVAPTRTALPPVPSMAEYLCSAGLGDNC